MTKNYTDQKKIWVAIQGSNGSFHEIAARKYFSSPIHILTCNTFDEIALALVSGEATFGCYAIENTLAGSILQNYSILKQNPLKVVGEEYLRIRQNLLALPGKTIRDIDEVHSHHMAIAQCRTFFKDYPRIKLVESIDTALSAKEISDHQITNRGTIASDLAAGMYGLDIIEESIETHKKNYTRFLILAKNDKNIDLLSEPDKASLCFSVSHHTGSLSKVLSVIAFYDINLTKIQSMPIIGEEWKYHFYIDVTFKDFDRYRQCLNAISPLVNDVQVLGEYKHRVESLENIHKSLKQ